ncbi:MAG: ArnT family glycosyltransferase [Flavisolibacter sp.]
MIRNSAIESNDANRSVYRRLFLQLSIFILVFKCILAFSIELGNDEAYYWLYSQYWQWNYFDHPPMVALWIRIFTGNLLLDSIEGFVRLGSIVGSILASWFLFRAVALLYSEKAGWYAALMYHASFYAGITAGLYILPDSPQMVFWTLSLWAIARITKEDSWQNWSFFGLAAGITIMCKVHGAFLWLGMGVYLIFFRTSWLKSPKPYVALLLTVIICSPIFIWNLQNNFATWRFHSNRVVVQSMSINLYSFLMQFGSQLGFNNPVNVFLIVYAFFFFRKKKQKMPEAIRVYVLAGVPLLLSLLVISLFRTTTLPHWSGPAYVSLIPAGAIGLAGRNDLRFPPILKLAAAIFLTCYIGWTLTLFWYPGTYGDKSKERLGRGDITLDMYGWTEAGKEFADLYREDVAQGKMQPNTPLVTAHWWGAHIEYYFARPIHAPFLGMGSPSDLHEYLWINQWRKDQSGSDAYCIVASDEPARIPSAFFGTMALAKIIEIKRMGKPAHNFFVYRLKGRIKELPVVK